MLEFVKKDKLPMVADKIENIYTKITGGDKSGFVNDFVNKYKDKPQVYGNSFYKKNPELMYIDAMFIWLAHNNFVGSITSGDDTLEVVDIKEYE